MSLTNDTPMLTAVYDVFLILATLILFHIQQHHCKECHIDDGPHDLTVFIAFCHIFASVIMLVLIIWGFHEKGQQVYVYPKNYWLLLWFAVSYMIITIVMTKDNLWATSLKKQSILYLQSKYNTDADACEKLCQDMGWKLLPIKAIDAWMEKIDEPTVEKVFDILRKEHCDLRKLQEHIAYYNNADTHVRHIYSRK